MENYCSICQKQLNHEPEYNIYLNLINRIWETKKSNDFCSKKCCKKFIEKCQKDLENLKENAGNVKQQ